MKHHKGKEEKSTSCAKQQRAPAGEKGRGVLDGRWSRSRAPTEGVSPSLGCDGSARHRAGGVLAPFKAGSVRGRANQGGTTKAMLSSLAGVSGKGRELFVAATERKKQTHE